jgi:hypothetical protein
MQNTHKEPDALPSILEEEYKHYFGNPTQHEASTGSFQMPTAYDDLRPVITTSTLSR